MVALLVVAAPAQATSGTFDCATLQAGLNQVADGDIITLQGICTGQQFTLQSFPDPVTPFSTIRTWTLRGNPPTASTGLDGTGLNTSQRMLTGVDVHRLEIQNLMFRDGNVTGDGGALDISGHSDARAAQLLVLQQPRDGKGGAVHFAPETPGRWPQHRRDRGKRLRLRLGDERRRGELRDNGRGLSIESPGTGNNNSGVNGSTFANNTATGNGGGFSYAIPPATAENVSLNGNVVVNTAGGSGGGGHVVAANSFLNIDNEPPTRATRWSR